VGYNSPEPVLVKKMGGSLDHFTQANSFSPKRKKIFAQARVFSLKRR